MKKCISILLIFLLVSNTFINTTVFLILKQDARIKAKNFVKKNLKNQLIEEIIIYKDELSDKKIFRFVKDDEFIYKGYLYDIIQWTTKDDYVVVKCINDTYEEKIIEQFVNSEKEDKNSATPFSKAFKNLGKNNYEVIPENKIPLFFTNLLGLISYYLEKSKSVYINEPDPPPKVTV